MAAIQIQHCGATAATLPHASRRHEAIDALGDAAHWAAGHFGQWRRRLRERAELARLDDRALLDIGITRADAEFLMNKPFWKE